MGLKNSCSVFSRVIHKLMSQLEPTRSIISYMDDIMIAGRSKEELFRNLEDVLSIFNDAGLVLSTEKCKICA